jgi:hypothetical protein
MQTIHVPMSFCTTKYHGDVVYPSKVYINLLNSPVIRFTINKQNKIFSLPLYVYHISQEHFNFKMRFSKLSVIAVYVYAATFASAQASAVQTNLDTISGDLAALLTAINSFTGTLAGALAVSAAASTLQTDYETALTETNAATDLESESAALAAAVQALVPPHADGLAALVEKVDSSSF